MNKNLSRSALVAAAAALCFTAHAADPAPTTTDQVVVPQVDRRDIKTPHFPSNDFEIGAFGGTYATQNFGTSAVGGVRLGYHITEDFFVEGVYAITKVSDELFRQILPGGIFPDTKEKLTYYNLSVGYNILPGELFVGGRRQRPTYNFGFGYRVYLADWAALQVDMRDHIFSLDLLGKRQSTQNLELTGGLAFFF